MIGDYSDDINTMLVFVSYTTLRLSMLWLLTFASDRLVCSQLWSPRSLSTRTNGYSKTTRKRQCSFSHKYLHKLLARPSLWIISPSIPLRLSLSRHPRSQCQLLPSGSTVFGSSASCFPLLPRCSESSSSNGCASICCGTLSSSRLVKPCSFATYAMMLGNDGEFR